MKRIVITLPEFFDGEADRITAMLDSGAARVHIRKPGSTADNMRRLLARIPPRLRERLSLHDRHELAAEFSIGGIHLNRRNPSLPADFRGIVSRSCHSFAEIVKAKAEGCDYTFLSPIYDSISKPGYNSAFTPDNLTEAARQGIIDSSVYALGGITPAKFAEIDAYGFGGAAILGAAWQPVDRLRFRLQFITPDCDGTPEGIKRLAETVAAVLDGGCRWVQLRMKDADTRQILDAAHAIAPLCRHADATFILDDKVELVEACGANGVHLGKNDMPVDRARKLLGPSYIIGATANTAADIEAAAKAGADYIGLGPLRFTTTKKNLSPVLGYEGYTDIIGRCRDKGIDLPVVAIGGIVPDDIAPLAAAGADGIAVSGAIATAPDPTEATKKFITKITAI